MTNWVTTLNLADVYHEGHPIPELSGIVAKRLKAIRIPNEDEYLTSQRDNIVSEFELLAADATSDAEDFDSIMSDLYDWADTPLDNASMFERKKLCWVKTR